MGIILRALLRLVSLLIPYEKAENNDPKENAAQNSQRDNDSRVRFGMRMIAVIRVGLAS